MKKIILILTLILLTPSNLFADENFKINNFNFWLYENGYHQYLSLVKQDYFPCLHTY